MLDKKIAYGVLVILLFVSGFLSYSYFSKNGGLSAMPSESNYQAPKVAGEINEDIAPNDPKTEACPLNGKLFSKAQSKVWAGRRPMGVAVENHTQSRPQSGLSSADVIYEAVAEGGITRFLSVFYCQDAKFVGPVRSARIYFIKLLEGYGQNPLYAHVGGANTDGPADALGEVDRLGWGGYNDLNQFSVPFPIFWRDYERLPDRDTEHTVYTNTAKLFDYAKTKRGLADVDNKGTKWDKGFKKWTFKDDAKDADRGTVAKVSFGFWAQFASDYGVVYNYNKATNSYARTNGGAPHLDKNTGKPLSPKNVVVVFAKESVANDGYDHGQHLLYDIIGSGTGLMFQDGKAMKITWSKKTADTSMTFTDESGKEVQFVRGQIFVHILPIGNKVDY